MSSSRSQRQALYTIFFLSGAAGLGYEIVWARMFAVGLGHEVPGLLAVVAAFFGGFAIGGWGLDAIVSRSRFPGRWYAGLELLIGAWAMATVWLIPWVNTRLATLIGPDPSAAAHWAAAFAVPFGTLAPATAAMGATLPAMDRFFSRIRQDGRSVGGLYAVNTLGAVCGIVAATFVLVPRWGFSRTILLLAAANFICAAAVLVASSGRPPDSEPVEAEFTAVPGRLRLGFTACMTGLLGIGYEVLGVRVMAQALENTIYSFASALGVYLLGTAIGAALYQRSRARGSFRQPLIALLLGLSIACLAGMWCLAYSNKVYEKSRAVFGGGFAGSLGAEVALAVLVFFGPSLLMGATFSHLAQGARRRTGGVGWALGLNTLGATMAPLVFGVWLLPMVGAKNALLSVALGYLLLLPTRRVGLAVPILCLAAAAWYSADLRLVEPPPRGQLAQNGYREGVMATVAVVEDADRHRLLKVNNRFYQGGTRSVFAQRRQAHIPLLLHPDPREALFLGLGTGITFGALTDHSGLNAEAVELLPEIIDLLPHFGLANRDFQSHPNLSVIAADARRYVRSSSKRYDVIVADLFHPARDGAGSLYTAEHFSAVRDRLAPGGLFCQWLPLYQHDIETFRTIVKTFLHVFPETRAFLVDFNVTTPALALIGTADSFKPGIPWLESRVRDRRLARALENVALGDDLKLFGCLMANRDQLVSFAEGAEPNTDDRPIVMFAAPRFAYAGDTLPFQLLATLMGRFGPQPEEVVGRAADAFDRRIDAYRLARNVFLRGEMLQVTGRREEAITLQLASLRTSPDFDTAYDLLVDRAVRSAAADPEGARTLLIAVRDARPHRSEAGLMLKKIFGL